MGDIADMMLTGILCSMCGEYIGEEVGYPVQCAGCRGEAFEEDDENTH